MEDLTRFIKHVRQKVALSDEEMQNFCNAFQLRKIKKKQFIIEPDFIAKYRTYVLEGAFRSYVISQDGIDHTIQFALEDWWISDINSYLYQQPATMFVVALEDSIVLQLDFETEQRLKKSNHLFETFFRVGAERTAAFHQRRIISALTRTAEERYDDFQKTYPTVAQRIPQYAVASYLGMSTEFLSRIRNRRLRKKLN